MPRVGPTCSAVGATPACSPRGPRPGPSSEPPHPPTPPLLPPLPLSLSPPSLSSTFGFHPQPLWPDQRKKSRWAVSPSLRCPRGRASGLTECAVAILQPGLHGHPASEGVPSCRPLTHHRPAPLTQDRGLGGASVGVGEWGVQRGKGLHYYFHQQAFSEHLHAARGAGNTAGTRQT